MKIVKILVADPCRVTYLGLKSVFYDNSNYRFVGHATNCDEVIALMQEKLPDIVFIDLAAIGNDYILNIKQHLPQIKFISFSEKWRKASTKLIDARLSKNSYEKEIFYCVESLIKEGKYMQGRPITTRNILTYHDKKQIPKSKEGSSEPTGRELEILKFIADGKTNKDIAAHLTLSIKTIETHRANLLRKLKSNNTAEMLSKAYSKSWLP